MAELPPPRPVSSAHATLLREMQRVAHLHASRDADPVVARALARIGAWQAERLAATYADLAKNPRYAAAIAFFQSDLYGNAHFARRDADLARIVPMLVRMLPERVIATVAHAMELNALTQELDRALLAQLPRQDGSCTVAEYCRAYRAVGDAPARARQIQLIGEIGAGLDVYVRKPLIGAALAMMRQPARVAGFGVLHDFLERGFAAFRNMRGAVEFLATIVRRERALMDAIFGGDDAPFREPVESCESSSAAAPSPLGPGNRAG